MQWPNCPCNFHPSASKRAFEEVYMLFYIWGGSTHAKWLAGRKKKLHLNRVKWACWFNSGHFSLFSIPRSTTCLNEGSLLARGDPHRVLGFKTGKNLVDTEMGEFRKIWTGIQLFDWSMNLFLSEIWIEFDWILGIDHSSSRWWGELGRYGEKLRRKMAKLCCFSIW